MPHTLFVGGEQDGKRLNVDFLHPIVFPMATGGRERYAVRKICGVASVFQIMVLETLTDDDVIGLMIQNYREGK